MKRWAFLFLLSIGPVAYAANDGTAYLPLRALPKSLAPDQLKIATDNYIFRQLTEGLFGIGEGFQIDPKLAQKAAWDEKKQVLSITLANAKFSDGTKVTPQAVTDSLRFCIRNSKKTLLSSVQEIEGADAWIEGRSSDLKGLKVKSDSEIEIRLANPAPLLLDDLAQAECHIVKPSPAGSLDFLSGAVGIGPFVFDRMSEKEIVLKRNPIYYGSTQGPERVVYRETLDFGDFEKLKTWVTMTTVQDNAQTTGEFRAIEFSEIGSQQVIFNNARVPFNRREIRRAVSLALDYGKLAVHMGWSHEGLQAGLVPLGMRGFRKRDLSHRDADLREARRLLGRLGFSERKPLKFTVYLSKIPAFEKEAPIWRDLFAGVPIAAEPVIIPHSEMIARQNKGDFLVMRVIKYPGSIEAHRLLASYLSESAYNPARNHLPKCDAITKNAARMSDREKRFEQYERADRCLMDEAILAPLTTLPPGYVMIRHPWKLRRTNRYLLYPYWTSEWVKDDK